MPHGPALPAVVGGRYRLTDRLGGGGMAQVYRAEDPQLDRTVAVKLMSPRLRSEPGFDARFRREAQIVSHLNDPHVVTVHDYGIDSNHGPFLVMELLEGRTLRQKLNDDGRLSPPAALQLGEQLMLALAHAHNEGVVHRDLKPDNVFLLNQSDLRLHVKVLDFGVSTIIGDATSVGFKTETGATVGTPRYMAPEQLAAKPATPRSDLYSLAVVLFESMTGQIPELMGPRLRERCPDVPAGLEQVIEQCLHGDPDERPVSATEAYLHLHETAREIRGDLLVPEGVVRQLTARFRPPGTARSSRRLWLAVTAVAIVAAPTLWWLFPRRHPTAIRESLLGLAAGAGRDELVAILGVQGRQVESDPPADLIRLAPRDVFATPVAKMEYARWSQAGISAAAAGSVLLALAVSRPGQGETGRRLRLGDSQAELIRAYPERPSEVHIVTTDRAPGWGLVYQYAELGLAVELIDGTVEALAIFPARKPPVP